MSALFGIIGIALLCVWRLRYDAEQRKRWRNENARDWQALARKNSCRGHKL
jgi:hypothetical protein